jgi:hypothetical protein
VREGRLTPDMQHSAHDTTLIAGFAAGDLADLELDRARTLVSTCSDCAALHRDLIAIAAATRSLPNLAHAPRDFRIDAAQAARLGRGSWLRAILRPFAAAGSATRPLAAAFTSLGVAGLLVVTVLPGILGGVGAATGPRPELAATGGGAPSAAPVAPAPGGPVAAATQAPDRAAAGSDGSYGALQASGNPVDVKNGVPQPTDRDAVVAQAPEPSPKTGEAGQTDLTSGLGGATPPNPLLVGSLALIVIGLGLFGLRLAARRLG